jgi:hypothetical protein
MADNSTVGLMFKITADPSEGEAGINAFAEQMKVAMQSMAVEIETLKAQLEDANVKIEELSASHRRLGSEATHATHAIRGIGEELGIHMPRFISSFLAHLEGVGPALASAFSVVAVIGIAEMITEQLPKAFDKLTEKITGWGESAKKDYDKLIEANTKLEESLLHFQMRMNEALGKEPEENLKLVEAKLTAVRKEIVHIQEELAPRGPYNIVAPEAIDQVDVLKERIASLGKQEEQLLNERNKLTQDVAIQAVKDEEETRRWFGRATEQSQKFQDERVKRAAEAQKKIDDDINKAWAAHVRHDDESRKADEATQKMEQDTAALRAKLQSEGLNGIVEFYNKQVEEADKGVKAINKTILEGAKERIRVHETEFKEQQAHIGRMLSLDENWYKEMLAKHQITQHQFDQLVKQATDRAYKARLAAIDQEKKLLEESHRTESAAYATLIAEKERLQDEWDARVQQSQAKEASAWKDWGSFTMGALQSVGGAMKQHHDLQVGLMIARAALEVGIEVANGLKALAGTPGVPGSSDPRGAALHFASAAEFAIVAGMNAASGGGGGGGGSSSQRVPAGGYPSNSPNGLPPAMSAGGGYGGGTVHVVVMGQSDGASYIAGMINDSVRYGGTQLTASHLVNPGSPT